MAEIPEPQIENTQNFQTTEIPVDNTVEIPIENTVEVDTISTEAFEANLELLIREKKEFTN